MKLSALVLALLAVSTPVYPQSPPAGHPPIGMTKDAKGPPTMQLPQKGKVLSSMDAAQYTYIEVAQNKKTIWLAGNKVSVKKGDIIRFDDGMVMTNFESKTLKRTFPSVTFVTQVVVTQEKE